MGHVFFCHREKAEGASPALQGWGLAGGQRARTLGSELSFKSPSGQGLTVSFLLVFLL